MPAVCSSLFVIDVVQSIGAGSAVTVANPGRTFKVLQVLVTGINGTACVVKKNNNSGAQVADSAVATGDLNAFPSTVVAADAVFTATDNVYISVSTQPATRVTLLCIAASGQDLTVT